MLQKTLKRLRRKNRIRSKVSWTASRPRLAVFRSNSNIYAQLIDDIAGKTLTSFSDLKLEICSETNFINWTMVLR